MSEPSVNYDQVAEFSVAPDMIAEHGRQILNLADEAAHSIMRIVDSFKRVEVGWAGDTKKEVKDFNDRWAAVMTELFGTEKNPEKGILPAMAGGVQGVAGLFSATERAIVDSFGQFLGALSETGSDGDSDTPPPSITDATKTAVTEQW